MGPKCAVPTVAAIRPMNARPNVVQHDLAPEPEAHSRNMDAGSMVPTVELPDLVGHHPFDCLGTKQAFTVTRAAIEQHQGELQVVGRSAHQSAPAIKKHVAR